MSKRLENAMNLYLEGIRDGRIREAITSIQVRIIPNIVPPLKTEVKDL